AVAVAVAEPDFEVAVGGQSGGQNPNFGVVVNARGPRAAEIEVRKTWVGRIESRQTNALIGEIPARVFWKSWEVVSYGHHRRTGPAIASVDHTVLICVRRIDTCCEAGTRDLGGASAAGGRFDAAAHAAARHLLDACHHVLACKKAASRVRIVFL